MAPALAAQARVLALVAEVEWLLERASAVVAVVPLAEPAVVRERQPARASARASAVAALELSSQVSCHHQSHRHRSFGGVHRRGFWRADQRRPHPLA